MRNILLVAFVLLLPFYGFSQASSRITAFAVYGADTSLPCTDTGGYIYHGDRGGQMFPHSYLSVGDYPFHFFTNHDFETGRDGLIKFDSSWESMFGDTTVSAQLFDANNNIIYASYYQHDYSPTIVVYSSSYSYDMYNRLVQETDSQLSAYTQRNVLTYDSSNRLSSEAYYSPDTSYWYLQLQTYNPLGHLTFNEIDNWNTSTHAWQQEGGATFKYNSSGLPDSMIVVDSTSGGVYFDTVTYYFSSGNDTMVFTNAIDDETITTTYDSHHNKISMTLTDGGGSYDQQWSYNSFDQVTEERDFELDSTGSYSLSRIIRYYYEPYVATGITTVAAGASDMSVFPSPAQNSATIKVSWVTPQPFTINVINTAGQLVQQWNEAPTQQLEKSIDVSHLPVGSYIITAATATQQLVKRFVVQHN